MLIFEGESSPTSPGLEAGSTIIPAELGISSPMLAIVGWDLVESSPSTLGSPKSLFYEFPDGDGVDALGLVTTSGLSSSLDILLDSLGNAS